MIFSDFHGYFKGILGRALKPFSIDRHRRIFWTSVFKMPMEIYISFGGDIEILYFPGFPDPLHTLTIIILGT